MQVIPYHDHYIIKYFVSQNNYGDSNVMTEFYDEFATLHFKVN